MGSVRVVFCGNCSFLLRFWVFFPWDLWNYDNCCEDQDILIDLHLHLPFQAWEWHFYLTISRNAAWLPQHFKVLFAVVDCPAGIWNMRESRLNLWNYNIHPASKNLREKTTSVDCLVNTEERLLLQPVNSLLDLKKLSSNTCRPHWRMHSLTDIRWLWGYS